MSHTRTLAIGDIHGCLRSLETLAVVADFQPEDLVISLGDYIDRGPDSKGVIDFLIGLQQKGNFVHLVGNHEVMMRMARQSQRDLPSWRYHGGVQTMASYDARTFDDIPESHWQFMQSAKRYLETDTHIFAHANVNPDWAMDKQLDETLFWQKMSVKPEMYISGKRLICGHTAQASGWPRVTKAAVCIDTFCYGGGWLTCLDVNSGHYWQANEKGETREGEI